MRGNVVDMAVGIIIGGAFGTIAKSLVSDVIMPPVGLLLGGVDFAAFLLIKGMDSLQKQEEKPEAQPTEKDCPHCFSAIPIRAPADPRVPSDCAARANHHPPRPAQAQSDTDRHSG